MKKVLISLVLLLATTTASLSALEWGGLLNNSTVISTNDFKSAKNINVNQGNDLFLWLNTSLVKDKSLRFAVEGVYKFKYDHIGGVDSISNLLDLNLLKLSGKWSFSSKNLLLDVGRFSYADKAGAYFNQKSDGVNLKFNTRTYNLGLYAGYTGLQNMHTVSMTNDLNRSGKIIYDLAYGYVPVMFDVTLNKIGPNSLGFQGAYFADVTGNKNNKAFGTIFMNGPFFKFGSYFANLVIGSDNFKNLMLFSSFDISLFLTQDLMLSFGSEYASGNNGTLSAFSPVTVRPVCPNAKDLDDYIVPRLSCVYMLGEVVLSLNEKLELAIHDKQFNANGLDSTLSVVYNIFSDLQVGATLNAFTGFKNSSNNFYVLAVNAALSF